jgi:manganese/zinc/iron transport system permease protein
MFGMLAGALGAFLSFLGPNLPTGPFMVLGASTVCGLAFLFSPRHGIVLKWWRHRSRAQQIQQENMLKAIYQVLESRQTEWQRRDGKKPPSQTQGPVYEFAPEGVGVLSIAERRREAIEEVSRVCGQLARQRLVTFDGEHVHLTPEGMLRACEVVRNHRLWELFLTNEAHFAADHVHDDAEKIEHVLGQEIVAQLEQKLQFPMLDPHGRPIPSLHDLAAMGAAPHRAEPLEGYGSRNA